MFSYWREKLGQHTNCISSDHTPLHPYISVAVILHPISRLVYWVEMDPSRTDPHLFYPWVGWIPLCFTLLGLDGSPRLKQISWLFCLTTVIFTPETLTIAKKVCLQITLINENHSFLSEQLAKDDMKTNDSNNERFLSDQSLCFMLLGSDRSPRLKLIPRLFCFMTEILTPERLTIQYSLSSNNSN